MVYFYLQSSPRYPINSPSALAATFLLRYVFVCSIGFAELSAKKRSPSAHQRLQMLLQDRLFYPRTDEERPSKADNSPQACNSDEAVTKDGIICFDNPYLEFVSHYTFLGELWSVLTYVNPMDGTCIKPKVSIPRPASKQTQALGDGFWAQKPSIQNDSSP